MARVFGDFRIPAPTVEAEVVRELAAKAAVAPSGTFGAQVARVTHHQRGYALEGQRLVRVDLLRGEIEITERWGGVITAREVRRLGGV